MSTEQFFPWWMVDLGVTKDVVSVQIRACIVTDANPVQTGYVVGVSNDPTPPVQGAAIKPGFNLCGYYTETIANGETIKIDCKEEFDIFGATTPTLGRYTFVYLARYDKLKMSYVRVYVRQPGM